MIFIKNFVGLFILHRHNYRTVHLKLFEFEVHSFVVMSMEDNNNGIKDNQ